MSVTVQDTMRMSIFRVEQVRYESRQFVSDPQGCYTISYVCEGQVETTCSGVTHIAGSGDVMIHPPHVPFEVRARQPGEHLFVNLALKVLDEVDFVRLASLKRIIPIRDRQAYQAAFFRLQQAWLLPDSMLRETRTFAAALELLAALIESNTDSDEERVVLHRHAEGRLAGIVEAMGERLHEKLTVQDLANLVHWHPAYFQRKFRLAYGVSPMEMLHKMRMRQVVRLLEDPDYTLDRIAADCGYYDAAHLNKAFRLQHRMTPGEYRKSLRFTKNSFDFTWRGNLDRT
ncbi:AraC family transcriptional regulator [Paenibacillus cymbidii]|uniref:AraC family transcriptional regulator n=1 Tax=Paenibacillus cymbidii TaxID=1639034 RepID=UPI0010806401|nr:AraC family transcriptional regulator [Paenibacillus cymbidii]